MRMNFVASCTWICEFVLFFLFVFPFLFCKSIELISLTFPPRSRPCILFMYPLQLWLSVKQYFTSLKPSQDLCFRRVLICILNIPNAGHFVNFWYTYMNDFYFHCHDKDLWSSLLCRLYIDGEKWATFCFPFCIILRLFLCCIPPTQCKVLLLLYYYYYCWVDCLENKNADFLWKPIALNL